MNSVKHALWVLIDFAVSDTWDFKNLFSCCCFITLNANEPELLCWPVPEDKRKKIHNTMTATFLKRELHQRSKLAWTWLLYWYLFEKNTFLLQIWAPQGAACWFIFYQWRGKLMTHLILWPHMLTLFMSLLELIYADCWAQNGSTQSHVFQTFKDQFLTNRMRNQAKKKLLWVHFLKKKLLWVHFLLYRYIYFLLMGPMMLLWFGSPLT